MDQILDELTQLAALTGESEDAIKAEALRHYLNWRLPQQRALQAAIVAADRDEFASADEVRARFARYGA
jgi:predicted transcriptional regulator